MRNRLLLTALALVLPLGQVFANAEKVDYQAVVDQAYAQFKDVDEGANADYIPILATVPSDMFGVVIVTRDGKVCLLYTSPSPRDYAASRMPSSA